MDSSFEPSIVSLQTVREKKNPGWNHFSLIQSSDGKKHYKCLHCGLTYKGGGINRMKQYLAGIKGNIDSGKKVSHDIRQQMQENLKGITGKTRSTRIFR
ncbi:hypothetical protein KSP39_PZI020416 [Platanthera zijinensis]|uniref:BED-type domain-containing protein n=1 Tax=Platanthera zijinensis TaxID=2320716 RepID=A0AAP0AZT7_9ASPA